MGAEERFIESLEETVDQDIDSGFAEQMEKRRDRLVKKNKAAIEQFMGKGSRVHEAGIVPRFYGELLTWALKVYMDEEGYELVQSFGYHGSEPVYMDVEIEHGKRENLLLDGQILAKKGTIRYIITVDINMNWRNSIVVEGSAKEKNEIEEFVTGVLALAKSRNFYRGKKIEFSKRLRLMDVGDRSWDSIILDEKIKKEIRANTVGFLGKKNIWDKYGIPSKRGVLLAGEPGTGKTIICKALMVEAEGLTCISVTAYSMDDDDYFTELYELAQDLSPCLVFIEDIDLVGQARQEFGYSKGNALLSLLSVLDGVEQKNEIVTVATTNCLEMLDKALTQRPSRFDRVIKLCRPGIEERTQLVNKLCQKVPLTDRLQEYVAQKTDGCTPAQVQEVIHSLVIELCGEGTDSVTFSEHDVDYMLSRINGRSDRRMGFCAPSNPNGHNPNVSNTVRIA